MTLTFDEPIGEIVEWDLESLWTEDSDLKYFDSESQKLRPWGQW